MNIVPATQEQMTLITQIATATWPETFGTILSKEQLVYMLEWMYSADSLKKQTEELGHCFIIAGDKGNYYGYASYELNYSKLPLTKIHKIYILPASQGKGIGQSLMNYVENIASKNGNTSMLLNVNKENSAIGFYERIGFKVSGREDIDIGNGFIMEDVVMVKKIEQTKLN